MLSALVDTGSDLVECDYVCTDGITPVPVSGESPSDYQVFEGKECFLQFLRNTFFVSVCNKLYRRSLLENQPFRKGVYHEDEFWTYRIFSRARKVCRLRYTGYYYLQREGSIVHTTPTEKHLSDTFNAAKERIVFIERHYPEYVSIGYAQMMYTCMYLFNKARCSDIPRKSMLQEDLFSCFRITFVKYLKKRQYQKQMWRFCFFCLFPIRYCERNY